LLEDKAIGKMAIEKLHMYWPATLPFNMDVQKTD
jgi:hypothetical protein